LTLKLSEERRRLLDLARQGGEAHFDPATGICLTSRDTCWYAAALLFDVSGDGRAKGNGLLSTIRSEDGTHTPATMIALLRSVPELLEGEVVRRLKSQVAGELVHAAETEWNNGNVNHPLGAYCTLICGGEMAGESWASDLGVRRLRRFQDRIGGFRSTHLRQAEMSEYNSLTYTALDLAFLALIAEFAERDDARRIALELERGLWRNVCMHFHAPSHQFAGPHSRSYHEDSVGGFSVLHGVFLAAGLGPLYMNPDLSVRYNHPSDFTQNALTAIVPFHVPSDAADIAWHKPFPYLFRMTTYGESYHENSRGEGNDGRGDAGAKGGRFAFDEDVYPGGWTDLTTFMTPEYALGSAACPYVNAGHSDSVMLRIRRGSSIGGMADFRSMFTRGVFNGALPGQRNFCHVASTEIDESYLYEEGRSFTYQHENRLIVCYNPKRTGHRGVTSFRVDAIFGYFAPFDHVAVDGVPVKEFPYRSTASSTVCLHDYHTYVLLKPLALSPAAGERPVLLRRFLDFFLVSLFSYEGEERDFTREEINGWRSGYYLEVHTDREFSGWGEFLEYAAAVTIQEESDPRGKRIVQCAAGKDRMMLCCDPFREAVVSRLWNGREERPSHFEVTAAGKTAGAFCPWTLYGREGR
jgi:hypothetical protein